MIRYTRHPSGSQRLGLTCGQPDGCWLPEGCLVDRPPDSPRGVSSRRAYHITTQSYFCPFLPFKIMSVTQNPFHKRFFHCYSNSMDILFCSHPSCSEVIAIKFCTWHDSCAVMACAKFVVVWYPTNGVILKPIFQRFELWWKNRSWNGTLCHINVEKWQKKQIHFCLLNKILYVML